VTWPGIKCPRWLSVLIFLKGLRVPVGIQDFRKSIRLLLVAVLCILSGCTSRLLQPDAAVSIKNVGILSLLPSELRYEKVGITIFNNESLSRPAGDALNATARAAAESSVARELSRKVIQLNEGIPSLSTKFYSRTLVISNSTERIQSDLAQIAKTHNLDAIIVIAEEFDSDRGRRGIRVYYRGLGFRQPQILPDFVIYVVNREGAAVVRNPSTGIGVPATRPGNKPWDSELDKSIDAETHAHVLSATERLISATVSSRIKELGL
jgi:hypothetical protein